MNLKNNFWSNKKVLITGHTGFKGSWLSLWLLKNGADVYGYSLPVSDEMILYKSLKLDNFNKSNANLFKSFEGDILDKNFLKEKFMEIQPDIIFHLAAQSLVSEGYLDPEKTWQTNVIGTINVLESLKFLDKKCSVIMVTTDKVYKNKEWNYGYREEDELGGHDPYSASKAACEIAISSWRSSYFGEKNNKENILRIASARSGNVIGGGDWSKDRIVPDTVRALNKNSKIIVRNPNSTRPWQHVLDPLSGYLVLAEKLYKNNGNLLDPLTSSFNFGPNIESNKKVIELIDEISKYWPGLKFDKSYNQNLHEANKLNLQTDKVFHHLKWRPKWGFENSVRKTIEWYKKFYYEKISAQTACLFDIEEYMDVKL